MTRHVALPVSLYVEGRRVVVLGDHATTPMRAARFAAAGALVEHHSWRDYHPAMCRGAFAVLLQHEGEPPAGVVPAEQVAADARAAGCIAYVADRPELCDIAMCGIAERGPLKLAISSDGVAPALTRRIREELERLLADAGERLDALVAVLVTRRAELPRPERGAALYRIASRLRFSGRIEIDGG